jgi:hypothetical protein
MFRAGKTFDEFVEAVRTDPETAAWHDEKGTRYDERQLRRIWEKADCGWADHGLDLVRVSDIVARSVRWLWPDRIARGKVTIVAGHPGTGKSQLALWIAAIVTTGGLFPVSGARRAGIGDHLVGGR